MLPEGSNPKDQRASVGCRRRLPLSATLPRRPPPAHDPKSRANVQVLRQSDSHILTGSMLPRIGRFKLRRKTNNPLCLHYRLLYAGVKSAWLARLFAVSYKDIRRWGLIPHQLDARKVEISAEFCRCLNTQNSWPSESLLSTLQQPSLCVPGCSVRSLRSGGQRVLFQPGLRSNDWLQ